MYDYLIEDYVSQIEPNDDAAVYQRAIEASKLTCINLLEGTRAAFGELDAPLTAECILPWWQQVRLAT